MTTPRPWQAVHGLENEKRPWLSSTTPRPLHTRQGVGLSAGLGAGAGAGRADRVGGEVQRGGHAADGVLEVQRQLGLEIVRPAAGPRRSRRGRARRPRPNRLPSRSPTSSAPTSNENPPAPGPRAAGAEAARAEAAGHRTEPADLVVLLAPGLVAEHVVGGRDLLEALLGLGVGLVGVGVVGAGQLPVRLGDLLGAGAVGARRGPCSSPSRTTPAAEPSYSPPPVRSTGDGQRQVRSERRGWQGEPQAEAGRKAGSGADSA